MTHPAQGIRGVVFDLDGTLYVSHSFATAIQEAAAAYIAGLRGIEIPQAGHLITATRARMSEEAGTVQTLSAVCSELGGTVQELHAYFESHLRPEAHLVRDERVTILLKHIKEEYPLYLFTNNNRALTTRILDYLGLSDLFQHIYAIDDTWQAKPDQDMLERILTEAGLKPHEMLFVGDRYDVDLRLPEQLGCPVYLSQTIEQLLRLDELLR